MDWSPKAGSAVVVAMFLRHMGLLDEALRHHRWVHRYRIDVFNHRFPFSPEMLHDPAYFKFKVVRNPFHRAVSSYIHAMKFHYADIPIRAPLRRRDAGISFADFVRFLALRDFRRINSHYAQQKKDYEEGVPVLFDTIVHIEDLESGIGAINRRRGCRFEFRHENTEIQKLLDSHHTQKHPEVENVSHMPWSRVCVRIPDYAAFYTPDLRRQVAALYRDDFETYGYSDA